MQPDRPSPLDPRMPPREACILRAALEYWTTRQPDQLFAWFDTDRQWSYAETLAISRQAGAAFRRIGVKRGEHVLVWLPNGPEMLRAWFGLNWIGAVFVPVNINYKGAILENAVRKSDSRIMVVHRELVGALEQISPCKLETLIVVGGAEGTAAPHDLARLDADILAMPSDDRGVLETPLEPWHPQSIIYTSGTTGPSKAVLSSYLHLWSMTCSDAWPFLEHGDRMLVSLPLFHAGGTLSVSSMLYRGGSIVMVDYFRTETFWQAVRASGATVTILVSAMLTFLLKQPTADDDRRHTLHKVVALPMQEATRQFGERFGCTIYTGFNMTEISTPIRSGPDPELDGICGTVRPGVEVRIVDENDCEVSAGQVGELILRTECPWALSSGYYGDPEATASAWRNGWFHTGDAFRRDAAGNFFFIDRKKDAIRRRGENISSFEVEAGACAHPAVREAAAVGVPSDLGEEDVLLVVAPSPGHSIDAVELLAFMGERMAHFMLPRFIRVMEELPKTPTGRVQKHRLRDEGVLPGTWDREVAGVKVRRVRL